MLIIEIYFIHQVQAQNVRNKRYNASTPANFGNFTRFKDYERKRVISSSELGGNVLLNEYEERNAKFAVGSILRKSLAS